MAKPATAFPEILHITVILSFVPATIIWIV